MQRTHSYQLTVTWIGNTGNGTTSYREYSREHVVEIDGKPPLTASADPAFRGDPNLPNPEDFLVAALSECHMLWYLALCSTSGVVVTAYRDEASATMVEVPGTGGHFTEVVLRPKVVIADPATLPKARELHEQAHRKCYIANSVNFPVRHEPEITTAG
ncbi:OsmC family peroxiredoxin [Saccharopolyspora hirsuta]|uniref:OsmC family peroxiredoxin n=1 Tax=Saccharopolyspora hirsuta TaxID=1837 RepID=A0A5M7B9G5_SACHI|nr:OsmC family protein [Saccharopolyspora hirsuta]KAA5825330.1 OsmC family peroxiredoxin [Saccharopolyspora hirsuta]MBF6512500.1 OsmC family protein [Nocardia farcinica]